MTAGALGDVGAGGAPGGAATAAEATAGAAAAPDRWCDRCGEATDTGSHDPCRAAREWEPPRFCPQCRRRMKVQVVPTGWSAICVEHGERHG